MNRRVSAVVLLVPLVLATGAHVSTTAAPDGEPILGQSYRVEWTASITRALVHVDPYPLMDSQTSQSDWQGSYEVTSGVPPNSGTPTLRNFLVTGYQVEDSESYRPTINYDSFSRTEIILPKLTDYYTPYAFEVTEGTETDGRHFVNDPLLNLRFAVAGTYRGTVSFNGVGGPPTTGPMWFWPWQDDPQGTSLYSYVGPGRIYFDPDLGAFHKQFVVDIPRPSNAEFWTSWLWRVAYNVAVTPLNPDLELANIRPVQAIFDVNVNESGADRSKAGLVAGKSTAFFVTVKCASNRDRLPVGENARVTLSLDGQEAPTDETDSAIEFPVTALTATGEHEVRFHVPGARLPAGATTVEARVELLAAVESKPANNTKTAALKFHTVPAPTYRLKLLRDLPSLALPDVAAAYNRGLPLVRGVMPLPDTTTFTPASPAVYDSPAATQADDEFIRALVESGFPLDTAIQAATSYYLDALALNREMNGSPPNDRMITLFPASYRTRHFGLNQAPIGWVVSGLERVAFVQEDWPVAIPHELGHTYGFGHVIASAASGYWVESRLPMDGLLDYMQPSSGGGVWTSKEHYGELFHRLRDPSLDPVLLHLDGIIDDEGHCALMYCRRGEGFPSYAEAGNASISVTEVDGFSGGSFAFNLRFGIVDAMAGEAHPLAAFSVSIPAPVGPASIAVAWEGDELLRLDVESRELETAIRWIPKHGFEKNAEERREALLHKADAFEKALAKGENRDAAEKLRNDIRRHVEDWLVPVYAVESSVYFTKSEVLAVIDRILSELPAKDVHEDKDDRGKDDKKK